MATIIKSGGVTHAAHDARPPAFNFDDVTVNAETYLEQVRRQAGQILLQAKQEAEQIKRRAETEGLKNAVTAAEKSLRATFDPQLTSLHSALLEVTTQLRDARQNWLAQWEQNAVKLATAIAARLVRQELERSPKVSQTWLREALELASSCARLEVRLNPRDLATLGKDVPALAHTLGGIAPPQVVADAQVSPGGCRIVTEFGAIENTLEAQLKRIEMELTE